MVLMGERPSGRYFCPMCREFFELQTQSATVTCPLMAQKCMATPAAIPDAKFSLTDLVHVYEVTPDCSARLIEALLKREDARSHLEAVLRDDWGFEPGPEDLARITRQMGL